ncbi:zinc ribbon domain-containing protein [candidate division WWE3 bacterium]|nr:zinc ribbon domain-containing protein [candidate division WWE3 bacterium]
MAAELDTGNLSDKTWREIAGLCPLSVRLMQGPLDDSVSIIHPNGTEGELTVVIHDNGWIFRHSALHNGEVQIPAAEGDATPAASRISLRIYENPVVVCPVCRHRNDPTYRYCDNCGADLRFGDERRGAPRAKPWVDKQPYLAEPFQPTFVSQCPACGASTFGYEQFCDSCGAHLRLGKATINPQGDQALPLIASAPASFQLELNPSVVLHTTTYRELKRRFGEHRGVYITWQVSSGGARYGGNYPSIVFAVDPDEMQRIVALSGYGSRCRVLPYSSMNDALIARLLSEEVVQNLPIPPEVSNIRAGFDVMSGLALLVQDNEAQVIAVVVGTHALPSELRRLGLISDEEGPASA